MPLDGTGFKLPVEVEPFKGGREGLAQLSAALRREMPRNFRWHFGIIFSENPCGFAGCAIGLGHVIWPGSIYRHPEFHNCWDAQGTFGLERPVAEALFQYGAYPVPSGDVTPAMVADRIDHWLETGEIR